MQIKMTLDMRKAFGIFYLKGVLHEPVCSMNKLVKR